MDYDLDSFISLQTCRPIGWARAGWPSDFHLATSILVQYVGWIFGD